MEALAAGRPVITSREIPMSGYIEDTGCGRVIETLSLDELAGALEDIRDHYDTFRAAAGRVGRRDLSAERMVGEYREIYRELVQ
jgi:glycosyltransferase involved in cell wall biosynthesis